jgi:hypothetical protein
LTEKCPGGQEKISPVDHQWIWIFPVSAFRWLWVPLALHLQKRMGFKALLVVATEQDRKYYLNIADGVLGADQVAVMPDYLAMAASGGDEDEVTLINRARAYEERFGITIMRDIVQSDRHLGRGFMPGWNRLPGSHAADRSTPASVLRACFQQADYYDALAVSRPPALIVANGSGHGVATKHVPMLCREANVPFRSLSMGRISSYYFWSDNEFDRNTALEKHIESFGSVSAAAIETAQKAIQPTTASVIFTKANSQDQTLIRAISNAALALIRHAYMRIRGYSKAQHGYRSLSKAYSCLRTFSDWRYLHGPDCLSLDQLPSYRDIVFFPLQAEPEVSIQGQSPECSHQAVLIHEICLSLPANALLVVKEHPVQIGRRPREIYELIKGMPNAVLVVPGESSLAIIARSRLVCTINSSAAYEAAMLGKTVAVFSHHGVINAVPHVHRIDVSECLRKIPELLRDDDAESVVRRKLDGARAYYAIQSFCMDLTSLNMYGRSSAPVDAELDVLSNALLESVASQIPLASLRPHPGVINAIL